MCTDGERRAAARAMPVPRRPEHSGPNVCMTVSLLLVCLLAGLPTASAVAAVEAAPQAATAPSDIMPAPESPGSVSPAPAPSGRIIGHMPNFGDQPATEGAGALYAKAVRVLSQVRETRYTGSYVVDEEAGRFALNCSGFLALLLYEVSPETLATVDRSGKHYRPRAEDFHRSILRAGPQGDGTGWLRLERVSELRPGDVVAWLRPAERSASSATGHVMVALASPRLNPARPGEVLLPVADCTLSPHGDLAAMREAGSPEPEAARPPQLGSEATLEPVPGAALGQPQPLEVEASPAIAPGIERGSAAWLAALPSDTREPGIGGVGAGVIGLATDAAGRPVAYWWRGGASRHRLVTSIMLGRLE
ncbi:hypothetical protein RVX_R23550 [Nitratidesulfovibrio sp. HK-II]|uniref:hypothetical protein n=1 Tax=Nitratidesulfovibrio sp. HK-II TaxID=2009266 RepID=UPI001E457CA7|nr:hypothetical protein [Nitratidesulfovibrio sp. HK-II]